MPAKVILNPYACRWKALEDRSKAEKALQEAGIEYELVSTEYPGHGIELAAQAVQQGFAPIISAGGDGSIGDVANGMVKGAQALASPQAMPAVGLLPMGSANDLVVNLGLPLSLDQAARVIAAGKVRRIDLGQVNLDGPAVPGQELRPRLFDNNSAIGLEPSITLIQQRIKRLRGVLRYLLATLIGIAQNKQWRMYLEWEGGEYHGPITLVTVGNNPLTGGLFYVTPHADPCDGKLTFVHAFMPTRFQVLTLLPRIMKPAEGSYVEHPAVHEIHTTWLRIRSEQTTPLHTDGEIQSAAAKNIEYSILPGALPILVS